ncbi:hypothetical protein R5R35_008569 [Gryllus longicercus]|uniref:N-acetyltransferase domain-containing protein n=1 Tax=Gryllus longicercus TaxID=2509291 RepID=A0AAN9V3T9_9ORTH
MSAGARWKRPAAVAVPRVWRRCAGRTPLDGKLPRFVIQDVPDDLHDAVVAFMSTFFPRDEPICAHLKLWTDAQSLAELQGLWRETLRQHVALVALLEDAAGGAPRIVGCNLLAVLYKEDQGQPNPYKGFAMRAFLEALNYHNTVVDPFERFGAAEALVGFGLSIDPAFRGQGLGLELLRARFDLGRAVGLRLTYTVFTAIQSQTLGARVGMDTLVEVCYKDYRDNGEPVLAGISFPPSMKLQARPID